MAKTNLPVNFKDDILKENMNGKRRFKMIQNSDGTVSFEDVTDYAQVGSTFGAAQINATNDAVNNAADASKIIDNLETIKANTQSGYIAGALAVKALSSNLRKITKLNKSVGVTSAGVTSANIKITEYTNYKNITIDNIFVQFARLASYPGTNQNMTYSYNASTGTLTITSSSSNAPFRSVSNDTVQFTVIIVD